HQKVSQCEIHIYIVKLLDHEGMAVSTAFRRLASRNRRLIASHVAGVWSAHRSLKKGRPRQVRPGIEYAPRCFRTDVIVHDTPYAGAVIGGPDMRFPLQDFFRYRGIPNGKASYHRGCDRSLPVQGATSGPSRNSAGDLR